MRTETILKAEAIDLLLRTFSVIETERFVASIKNSNFDYTEWHSNLWKDKSIEKIHKIAIEFEKQKSVVNNPSSSKETLYIASLWTSFGKITSFP